MCRISLLIALITSTSIARFASAQNSHFPLPPAVPQSQDLTVGSRPTAAPIPAENEIQRQQAMAANQLRQIEIRRDTKKIAELTQELNDYLAKTGEGMMSVDAIKKAEQIEKLAHSLKSKMKQSF